MRRGLALLALLAATSANAAQWFFITYQTKPTCTASIANRVAWEGDTSAFWYCDGTIWNGICAAPPLAGEPYVTFAASVALTNERVLSAGNYTTIDLGTVGQAQVDLSGLPACNAAGETLQSNGAGTLSCQTARGQTLSCAGSTWVKAIATGAGTCAQIGYGDVSGTPTLYYQTAQDEGGALTQRPIINFTGAGVTCSDDGPNTRTNCDISGASGGTNHNVLSATHLDTLGAGSEAQGDLIFRSDGGYWINLHAGTSGQVLHSGAQPTWSAVADSDLASNYSGTGACAGRFVTAVNDNAAPTCYTAATRSDLIYGSAAGAWDPLSAGASVDYVLHSGTAAADPSWKAVPNSTGDQCTQYNTTTHAWGARTIAPHDATYITQTANGTLTAEQNLAALGTGLMMSTTGTGVVSTLPPTDDTVPVGSGAVWQNQTLPGCDGGMGLVYSQASNTFSCAGGSERPWTFSGFFASIDAPAWWAGIYGTVNSLTFGYIQGSQQGAWQYVSDAGYRRSEGEQGLPWDAGQPLLISVMEDYGWTHPAASTLRDSYFIVQNFDPEYGDGGIVRFKLKDENNNTYATCSMNCNSNVPDGGSVFDYAFDYSIVGGTGDSCAVDTSAVPVDAKLQWELTTIIGYCGKIPPVQLTASLSTP